MYCSSIWALINKTNYVIFNLLIFVNLNFKIYYFLNSLIIDISKKNEHTVSNVQVFFQKKNLEKTQIWCSINLECCSYMSLVANETRVPYFLGELVKYKFTNSKTYCSQQALAHLMSKWLGRLWPDSSAVVTLNDFAWLLSAHNLQKYCMETLMLATYWWHRVSVWGLQGSSWMLSTYWS